MLNNEQRIAVEHKKGPLLIVAGAGTGKTLVITEKIKWLIDQKLAKPEEILALTFTEKAAKEMEERIDLALPYGTFGMWVMTFHSFCDQVLKYEALQIGLNPHYKLLTEAETYLLVKKNFWKFDLNIFRPHGNPYKFIDGMIQHFSRLKDEDVDAKNYKNEEYPELVGAFKTYEELKIAEGVMDFADLISNVLALFRQRKNILENYQKKFKYILVDEFQDTNFAQYQLIKLLAPPTSNLTVVGDDSQSIYKFRGAAISNILTFMKDYPKSKQVILTKNYRSTQTILDAAYKLIKNNDPDTLEATLGITKDLVSQVTNGEPIELIQTERVEDEAEEVINRIKLIKVDKTREYEWKDFAILVRANNHSDAFVRALERNRIPFQFLGPGRLFRQPEILDLIAYLRVLADFTDSVSLYRVLSMEIFNFSQRDLIEVLNKAKKVSKSLFEQIETEEKFEDFIKMIHRHQELVRKETGGQILYFFLEDSGLLKSVVNYKSSIDERKALNITKFFDKLKAFESANTDAGIFNIVEFLNLALEMGESPTASEIDWVTNNAVNILTIHSAKGLEFPVVILVNLTEGRFPTRERKEQIPIPEKLIKDVLPTGDFHLEEERRLFYVGMTRAKEKLIFSVANFYGEGKRERKPSPFIKETGVIETPNIKPKQVPLFEWNKPTLKIDLPKPEPLKIDYLSYSAIETFNICPLHYKLRVILKIPTPMTPSQALGNSMHLVLNEIYKDKNKKYSEKEVLEILNQYWIQEGYGSTKHRDDTLEKARDFIKKYLKTDLHLKANPIYLEQPFVFHVALPAGWLVQPLKIGGKIDRVDEFPDGSIEIIDYKTGAKMPPQKEIDENLQMTIYALAATSKEVLNRPIDKVKTSFYFFENETKISTIRTRGQLEEAKKTLLAIRDQIEHSDFLCSHNKICDNCEFKMLCG